MLENIAGVIVVGLILITCLYVAWIIFKRIVYRCSNLIARGVYDAKNRRKNDE